jgi:hypothetical protein
MPSVVNVKVWLEPKVAGTIRELFRAIRRHKSFTPNTQNQISKLRVAYCLGYPARYSSQSACRAERPFDLKLTEALVGRATDQPSYTNGMPITDPVPVGMTLQCQ